MVSMTTLPMLRCTNDGCDRRGRPFAFTWFQPGREVGPEPKVWCPSCKKWTALVTDDGTAYGPSDYVPQRVATRAELDVYKSVIRAERAQTASGGRIRHGQSAE